MEDYEVMVWALGCSLDVVSPRNNIGDKFPIAIHDSEGD